jgi:hypothetical protein
MHLHAQAELSYSESATPSKNRFIAAVNAHLSNVRETRRSREIMTTLEHNMSLCIDETSDDS